MHSSLGLGLPRVAPLDGETICDEFFPEGQGVIMNACVINFNKKIFGEDADQFIPERWMRNGVEKANEMERHMLQFGYGPRICIGKHITNIEMYKLLPTILRDFEFVGLEDKTWKVFGGWFHHQSGVDVRVRRRRPRDENATVEIPVGKWRGE